MSELLDGAAPGPGVLVRVDSKGVSKKRNDELWAADRRKSKLLLRGSSELSLKPNVDCMTNGSAELIHG